MAERDSPHPPSPRQHFSRWSLLFTLGLMAALGLGLTQKMADRDKLPLPSDIQRVAHAGGIFQGKVYTNSLKAIEANAAKGFRHFEVDLAFTRDGRLVCNHSWTTDKSQPWVERPMLKEFQHTNSLRNIPQCTIYTLMRWVKNKPDIRIISDIKEDNLKALRYIAIHFRDQRFQVIPQVHHPREIHQVRAMGFNNPIWTLYRSHFSDRRIVELAKTLPTPIAITLPERLAMGSLPARLRGHGIIVYSHTINDANMLDRLKKNGISEVYTDSLIPLAP